MESTIKQNLAGFGFDGTSALKADVVDWIRSRNSLQESNLEIGQRLTVPEPASV